MRINHALILTLLIAGCDSSPTESPMRVVVSTQWLSYAPGDTVVVRIQNLAPQTLAFSTCPPKLLRWSDGSWVETATNPLPCGGTGRLLVGGALDSARIALQNTIPAGTYKYVFEEFGLLDTTELTASERETNSFTIE